MNSEFLRSVQMDQDNPSLNTDITASLKIGLLSIDRANRTAFVNDRQIDLTVAEFDVLWYLAKRAGQTVTRDELYKNVLFMEYDGLNRCLDLRIARLRKKMRHYCNNNNIIKSIRCEGYLLVPNCI